MATETNERTERVSTLIRQYQAGRAIWTFMSQAQPQYDLLDEVIELRAECGRVKAEFAAVVRSEA